MFSIVIPSYKRSQKLKNETLNTLDRFHVEKSIINIFVVEEEYEEYKSTNPEYNIIIGEKGIVNQRRFIENYYQEGDLLLFLDDDITDFDLLGKKFNEFVMEGFRECINYNSYIFSIYPVWNKYFREKQIYMTTCLNFCVGAFYGIINRPNKFDINNYREDVERSIQYFVNDGIVIRFNQIGFKTKYYSVGGLGLLKERMNDIINEVEKLVELYPSYGKRKIRKNGIHEFVLNKIAPSPKIINIKRFNIPKNTFDKLYEMLNKIKIPFKKITPNKNNSRIGFPTHRGCVWGISKARFTGKVGLSHMSLKYPIIYDEIVRIGKLICPFEFQSIQLNHNLVCPKHKDSNNVGLSLLVSFGKYEGCNIVVDGNECNTNCSPVIFNGAEMEHWNSEFIGDKENNKYSLIYFNL
jgi:hypothetical protein